MRDIRVYIDENWLIVVILYYVLGFGGLILV